jgi:hypothetical protein
MKFIHHMPPIDPGAEEDLVQSLRRLGETEPQAPPPPDAYFQNLIARTNARIDEASSGRALTISWAARVAIPGVVAILSFLIGLHYFVPRHGAEGPTLKAVVLSLPAQTIDSLMLEPSRMSSALTLTDVAIDPFVIGREDAMDYLFGEGNLSDAAGLLTEKQMTQVLALLSTSEGDISSGVRR